MGRGDRLCYRLKRKFPVVYQPVESAHRFYTVSADISTTGVGILAERALEKDGLLDLELYLPGRLPKLPLRGRVMFQKPVLHRRKQFFLTGIHFEDPPEQAAHILTKFIAGNLRMSGLRAAVMFLGGLSVATVFCRAFFYTTMALFRGTAFGREWVDAPWRSLPLIEIAALHALFAVFGLIACLSFYFMRRKASLAVLAFAGTGSLAQGIRCAMKSPYLFQDRPGVWIFGSECGVLLAFLLLTWIMLKNCGTYEKILASIQEDLSYKPALGPDASARPKRPYLSLFRP